MSEMQVELRGLHSPDVDLEKYQTDETASFGFLVEASIGIKGQQGEEIFTVVVCSPQWFAERYPGNGYVWGGHHLFMNSYRYSTLRKAIADICRAAEGTEWGEIVWYLRQYASWEFANYTPKQNKTLS